MPSPVILNERTFDRIVAAYDVAVVDFWGRWCRSCRAMSSVVERLCREHPAVLVAKVDVDRAARLAQRFSVTTVPTIVRLAVGGRRHSRSAPLHTIGWSLCCDSTATPGGSEAK